MKSLDDTIKILLRINFLTGLTALGVFVLIRSQQSILTSTQQEKSHDTLTYRSEISATSLNNSPPVPHSPEVVTLNQYRKLENQFKALERQVLSAKSAKMADQPPVNSQLTAKNQQNENSGSSSHPQQSVTIAIPSNPPATATPGNLKPQLLSNPPDATTSKTNQPRPVFNNQQETEENKAPESVENSQNTQLIAVNQPKSPQKNPKISPPVAQKESISINLVVTPPPETNPEPTYALIDSKKEELIGYANDISAGLLVAGNKGHINHGTTNYRRVQTAIALLRKGEDIEDAARRAQISRDTLQQLIKWGENRPGSFTSASTAGDSLPRNWN
jgi:hypothetical protein